MGRKPNANRKPIPTNIRVRMHRQRQRIKKAREIPVDSQIGEDVSFEGTERSTSALKTKLRDWANTYMISKRAVDSLLSILNSCGIKSVPKNHRTLLGTPLGVEINELSGGKYWYNGLEKCLRSIFSTLDRDISIKLNFNIDGLPIYNSSKTSFWPILASIHGLYANDDHL